VIRAVGKDEQGKRVTVVGLSAENITRLRQSQPILADYPDGSRVLVLYGDTEADVIDDLRALGYMRDERVGSSPERPH